MSTGVTEPEPRSHHRAILGAILLIAILLRVVNFVALADGPCLLHHTDSDMAFFDAWSQRVAGGDVWTDAELHPLHRWHRRLATSHLEHHPDEIDGRDVRKLDVAKQSAAYTALWNRWYGGKTFHQEPLYPYALALIRAFCGNDLLWIQLGQMLLGVCGLLLLHAVTRIYFGAVPALCATVLAALSGPLLFFELHLLRAAPIAVTTLLLVWALERTRSSPTPRRLFAFGLCIGAATLLKIHFAVFGACALVMLARPRTADPAVPLPRLGIVVGAGLLALVPVWIRNAIVGAPFFGMTSVGPVTFANTNHSTYRGHGWAEDTAALETLGSIMGQAEGAMWPSMTGAIATHDSVGSYLGLLWTKFQMIWHWVELPNNVNYYFGQMHSTVLALLPVSFTAVAVLALVGILAALATRRAPVALLVFIALAILQFTSFYTLARLRCGLTIALLPLAGFGLAWLVRTARDRRFRHLVPVVVAAGLFGWWVQRPLPTNSVLLSSTPYANSMTYYYRPEWAKVLEDRDWERGEALMQNALAARPPYLDKINMKALPDSRSKWNNTGIYAEIYRNLAASLQGQKKPGPAAAANARSQELTQAWQRVDALRRGQKK